jgi:hypothetical protein
MRRVADIQEMRTSPPPGVQKEKERKEGKEFDFVEKLEHLKT